MFNRRYGIILACDVPSLQDLTVLVQCGEKSKVVVGYKVGFALGLRFGLSQVVDTIRSVSSCPVIYDHQKAGTDIPRMGTSLAQCCKDAGINGIIVFPQAGPKTMVAFIEAIRRVGLTPIIGGAMTHPAFLRSEGGYIDDSAPSEIYCKAVENGVDHFVIPGNRPDLIHKYVSEISNMIECTNILMPGIGTQGGQIDKAFSAASGHKCYAIVGSTIYDAPNMKEALDEISQMVLSYEHQESGVIRK
jgi:orotidine-5'-phosphate decarboxylase